MSEQSRCWSCQAFLAAEQQGPDGYYCPNCGDDAPDADLEMNGYEYNDERGVWER